MSKLKKAWEYIRQHKYLITILVFLLIIGVLDEENSLIQRFSHWREIQTLNTEIEHRMADPISRESQVPDLLLYP